jgi:short-subunit dehydrogenase
MRGHDLVLVARDRARLEDRAARLRKQANVSVDIIQADLTHKDDLASVESRLREDERIQILVNNAGSNVSGKFVDQSPDALQELIALNATAVVRLASAVAPRFAKSEAGAIINIGSVVGLAPEIGLTVYGATKAFVLFFSQGLSAELSRYGVYVQAVLPSATQTEIWKRSGSENPDRKMMDVEELVDAALVGYDRRELITIPSLLDVQQWENFDAARKAMRPSFANVKAVARYRVEP